MSATRELDGDLNVMNGDAAVEVTGPRSRSSACSPRCSQPGAR